MTTLQNLSILTFFTIIVAFASCKMDNKKPERSWSELPEVTALEKLKQTDFVPTLENPIAANKNIIYAPAFLYAWDKVKQKLKTKIVEADNNSLDFKLLTNSKSYINSMNEDEYSVTVDFDGDAIMASAFFNKTLPFETKLQKMEYPINFGKTKVSAFGMHYFDEEVIKFSHILFYENDNKFILKLIPKDKQHEMIFVKGLDNVENLADAVNQTTELIKKGKEEKSNPKNSWKYEILPEDNFAIPTIKFNLATNYVRLEGQTFKTSDHKNHVLYEAYQRTGLILNENGASVTSEVFAVTDSIGAEPKIIHHKKMKFDKTFYIIIKRIDKSNPYFVMKVDNEELMTKE